ncbi:MAG TPA: glycoside hydrolase family 2 TIM barrel-domain containing protein [Bryobacteraceae bacterium]|nr:glycoside hydrolase family 2 TIM barrel-domain containing protein [Bryobacteraceae bacterium]HPU73418.1 glycoside hydrolase family 2 TIM barrel-domain containing protein [Bryobacteraceae bacterium]
MAGFGFCRYFLLLAAATLAVFPAPAASGRVIVSLDGTWEVDESIGADDMPTAFRHRGPVPGLANLARPPFPDVDLFDSRESLRHPFVKRPATPEALAHPVGIPRQKRNYFWYRTSFRVPERKQIAILKVNKAQFGTAVWLNGKKIGEHLGCFTAGYFDLTPAINWTGENRLVVRIGAHPAVLPVTVPAGTDLEKLKWTPGIYDSVSVLLSDNPVIRTVQVAPRIGSSEIVVQTVIRNYGAKPALFELIQRVRTWKEQQIVAESRMPVVSLDAGEEKTWTQTIKIPGAVLWSPENPFLYQLETNTGGDHVLTRFGMREFRFDSATKRAYLNGQVYFMRGSNITLHRFFEDPDCGDLPWREEWVRKLLVELPKRFHWNSFRFCIGPVPDFWLDIADEAGLLIQNEFFIWTYHDEWDTAEVVKQYAEWMRDNWNHPSVVIWDAQNETVSPIFAEKIIPSVRHLDLSNRPWENGWSPPAGPDDPVEQHPYLTSSRLDLTQLERGGGAVTGARVQGHAQIINEYEWLWLNRDGTPTTLTEKVYASALGKDATPQQRFEEYAYSLAAITEYWRAHRNMAGVLYFTFLTASFPGAFTSDNFRDVKTLELEPHFADYMPHAFNPLGVYVNFFQRSVKAGSRRNFRIIVINDEYRAARGKLALVVEAAGGKEVAREEIPLYVPPNGQQIYDIPLVLPSTPGKYMLKAIASADHKRADEATVCRRRLNVVAAEAAKAK